MHSLAELLEKRAEVRAEIAARLRLEEDEARERERGEFADCIRGYIGPELLAALDPTSFPRKDRDSLPYASFTVDGEEWRISRTSHDYALWIVGAFEAATHLSPNAQPAEWDAKILDAIAARLDERRKGAPSFFAE